MIRQSRRDGWARQIVYFLECVGRENFTLFKVNNLRVCFSFSVCTVLTGFVQVKGNLYCPFPGSNAQTILILFQFPTKVGVYGFLLTF